MARKLHNKTKLVHGVGINDADYPTQPKIDGKAVRCPYYVVWVSMIKRCYSEKLQKRQPTYKGCSVCTEWLYFMNFRKWMIEQDWEGKALDKDLIVEDNKVYSPVTCAFVNTTTNSFTIDCGKVRGDYPTGVSFHKHTGKFVARCSNPFTNEREHLGYFHCPHEAHLAWKARKHQLACQLADLQTDPRVAEALRTRYL